MEATEGRVEPVPPSEWKEEFIEAELLLMIFLLCDHDDLPALQLVCKHFSEIMDEKWFLEQWTAKVPSMWEVVLRGSEFLELRVWRKEDLPKLEMDNGRIQSSGAYPLGGFFKGGIVRELGIIHVPDVGQFLETPYGCSLISAASGIWLEKVDFVEVFQQKKALCFCKKETQVYFFRGVLSAHIIHKGVAIYGTVNEHNPSFMVLANHNIPREYLLEHSLWCCKFPKTNISIVGLNPATEWDKEDEETEGPNGESKDRDEAEEEHKAKRNGSGSKSCVIS